MHNKLLIRDRKEIMCNNVCYSYPPFVGNILETRDKILSKRLYLTSFKENVSLIHSVIMNNNNDFTCDIIERLKENILWCFTLLLVMPGDGVYIKDMRRSFMMNEVKIIESIKRGKEVNGVKYSTDKKIRFVPFGYNADNRTANHPLYIALAGEDGAKQLEDIASKYSNKPCLFSPENIEQKATYATALNSNYKGDGLGIYINCRGACSRSIAFGKY